MKVTRLAKVGRCKSMKDGERYQYFEGLPPLPPGHNPDENDPGIVEIEPPLHWGAHTVYKVEGEGVETNETATFTMIKDAPVCWMAQSGVTLQGRKAIKRVFGDLFKANDIKDPSAAIGRIREALGRLVAMFNVKYILAVDGGDGYVIEASNDPDGMDKIRKALTE